MWRQPRGANGFYFRWRPCWLFPRIKGSFTFFRIQPLQKRYSSPLPPPPPLPRPQRTLNFKPLSRGPRRRSLLQLPNSQSGKLTHAFPTDTRNAFMEVQNRLPEDPLLRVAQDNITSRKSRGIDRSCDYSCVYSVILSCAKRTQSNGKSKIHQTCQCDAHV